MARSGRFNVDGSGYNKKLIAYLMTMLSEIPSAVLSYLLQILIVFLHAKSQSQHREMTRRDWTNLAALFTMARESKRPPRPPQKYIMRSVIRLHAPSMSSLLSLSRNHSAAALALCGSVRSIGSHTNGPGFSPIPSCPIREIACSAFSSLLAAMYTFAPRLTRWSAM